jgi:uncharacterized SAM-binding protein YcdF (DUF218 family)
MFFILSKVFWMLVSPGNLLLLLLALGVGLLLAGRAQAGVWLTAGVTAAFLVLAVLPVGAWLVWPLETRFPRPEPLPEPVDGIVVLGGMVDPGLSHRRGDPVLYGTIERFTEFFALARQYPEARLVFTGGSGSLLEQEHREATVARALAERLGLPADRVLWERESRNTWENAVRAREVADPQPGETWLLVTSAFHMPRAVGAFRAAGWTVVPYPTDYRIDPAGLYRPGFSFADGLGALEAAAHEWIGLVAYSLTDRSSAVFPAPAEQEPL